MTEIDLPPGGHFIGGAWLFEGDEDASIDPATGESMAIYRKGSEALADAAVDAALRAFQTTAWAQSPRLRAKVLADLANVMRQREDELVALIIRESGKKLIDARFEVRNSFEELDFYAGVARTLYGRSLESAADTFSFMMREPAGVVAVIVPWNAPVILLIRSLAPALAAGCTVVVKPAPQTPMCNAWVMARLAELADLPKGVVNSVNEDGTTVGRRYVASEGVDVVSFTGSSETGKRIMAAAAPTLKRLSLELGGKAPSIVFPDADLDQVVPQLVRGGLLISGQMCIAITRVLVHASIADTLADRLIAALRGARIGSGADPATQLAPLIDLANRDRVVALAAAAHEQGEVLLQGKACDGDLAAGAFVSPTLVRIENPAAALVQEEVFGPLLTLETFEDEDHAIALANNSRYGLSSSLWTRDVSRCFRVARRIESGTVWLNSHGKLIPEAETGGYKQSGIGRLHGIEAMNDFLETKHIYLEAGR